MPTTPKETALYDSYSMIHPDGTFMCYCSEKKANWYISRGIATWISNKEFKLLFEPNGKGKANTKYYHELLENRCVVCGSTEQLNKHHVVPYVFRRRFPIEYKKSNHHDILATCLDCHEKYEEYALQFKSQFDDKYGTTINLYLQPEMKNNRKIQKARSLLEKIKHKEIDGEKIPKDKLKQMEQKASEPLYPDFDDFDGSAWADVIMDNIIKEDKLYDFIKSWRQHFLDFAKPKFMPKSWSVEHPMESIRN